MPTLVEAGPLPPLSPRTPRWRRYARAARTTAALLGVSLPWIVFFGWVAWGAFQQTNGLPPWQAPQSPTVCGRPPC